MEIPTVIVALFIYVFVILGIVGLGGLLIKYWVSMGDGLLFMKVSMRERIAARKKQEVIEEPLSELKDWKQPDDFIALDESYAELPRKITVKDIAKAVNEINSNTYVSGANPVSGAYSVMDYNKVSMAVSGVFVTPKEERLWHENEPSKIKRDTVEYLDPSIPYKSIEALRKEAEILEKIEMKKYLQGKR